MSSKCPDGCMHVIRKGKSDCISRSKRMWEKYCRQNINRQIITDDGNIYVNGTKSSVGIILPVKTDIIMKQSCDLAFP